MLPRTPNRKVTEMTNAELIELAKTEQETEKVVRGLLNNKHFFIFVDGCGENITAEKVHIFLAAVLATSMNLPTTEEARNFTMSTIALLDCEKIAQMTRDYIKACEDDGLSLTVGEMG